MAAESYQDSASLDPGFEDPARLFHRHFEVVLAVGCVQWSPLCDHKDQNSPFDMGCSVSDQVDAVVMERPRIVPRGMRPTRRWRNAWRRCGIAVEVVLCASLPSYSSRIDFG